VARPGSPRSILLRSTLARACLARLVLPRPGLAPVAGARIGPAEIPLGEVPPGEVPLGGIAYAPVARIGITCASVVGRRVALAPVIGLRGAPPGIAPPGITPTLVTTARAGTRLVRVERGVLVELAWPVRVRPVQLRAVQRGIGPGGATIAGPAGPTLSSGTPGRPAILPEGLGGGIRARGGGIPPIRPAPAGASARPKIRPRHATIRRARIRIVPSWLGHLVSDVSR